MVSLTHFQDMFCWEGPWDLGSPRQVAAVVFVVYWLNGSCRFKSVPSFTSKIDRLGFQHRLQHVRV